MERTNTFYSSIYGGVITKIALKRKRGICSLAMRRSQDPARILSIARQIPYELRKSNTSFLLVAHFLRRKFSNYILTSKNKIKSCKKNTILFKA